MPVGVNLEIFKPVPGISREPRSVVFLARMSQSKKPDVLVEALGELANKKEDFKAKFFGNPPIGQEEFYDKLKNLVTELKLSPSVSFVPGVANSDAPSIFSAFEIFVNLSPAGMYDKTIFEAAACGCLVLATSPDFAALVGDDRFYVTDTAPKALADKLAIILNLPEAEKESLRGKFKSIAAGQGLKNLSEKIFKEIKAK